MTKYEKRKNDLIVEGTNAIAVLYCLINYIVISTNTAPSLILLNDHAVTSKLHRLVHHCYDAKLSLILICL